MSQRNVYPDLKKDKNMFDEQKISENIIPNITNNEIDSIIKKIHAPVKIIYGDHDNVIPKDNILKLNDSLKNSSLTLIEACGHVPQEEYPEQIANEVLHFLE